MVQSVVAVLEMGREGSTCGRLCACFSARWRSLESLALVLQSPIQEKTHDAEDAAADAQSDSHRKQGNFRSGEALLFKDHPYEDKGNGDHDARNRQTRGEASFAIPEMPSDLEENGQESNRRQDHDKQRKKHPQVIHRECLLDWRKGSVKSFRPRL